MVNQCSYTGVSVDENTARFAAFLTVVIVALAVATGWTWILALLGVDFALRAWARGRGSLLAATGRRLSRALGLAARPVDAGPKAFAAKIGVVFSLTAAVLGILGQTWAAAAVALVLGACAALEAFVGFCVGCLMYSVLMRVATRLGLYSKQRQQHQSQ